MPTNALNSLESFNLQPVKYGEINIKKGFKTQQYNVIGSALHKMEANIDNQGKKNKAHRDTNFTRKKKTWIWNWTRKELIPSNNLIAIRQPVIIFKMKSQNFKITATILCPLQ